MDHKNTKVRYDDGYHYHAYATHQSRAKAAPSAAIVALQDVVIDNMHLKGHTDERCKSKFNPKLHPKAKSCNTQGAEQTFSWFARFKHIGRHMAKETYWILILGLFHERNKIFLHRRHTKKGVKRSHIVVT